ncbi:MAG TPA: DUF3662 and FHA domain-containing protein [Mycobacteriales bacterium]|jgi:hypothetical protein|nr:DUF3662 and FHA domain-containing protein [Mycobacteriales bacterium]
MGVLQRFERRLEGLVEGTFAKVFRGGVEPVEVAKALQREAADKKAIGAARTLVPNAYVVELGERDHGKLQPYERPLGAELAAMVREHAAENRWEFVGPVTVRLERHDDVDTGTFRVRSAVEEGEPDPVPTTTGKGAPRLRVVQGNTPTSEVPLTQDVLVIGRGSQAGLRLDDTGVSRQHAEVRREGDDVVLVDLGSTNGSSVNGRHVERVRLTPGDRIELGRSVLVYERDER